MQKKVKLSGVPRQRKDKMWVWSGTLDLPDGSTKRVDIVRKRHEDCVAEVNKLKQTMVAPTVTAATFGEWFNKWLYSHYESRVATTTFENAVSIGKCHITPKLGNIKLKKLSKPDIQRFVRDMSKTSSIAHAFKALSIVKQCLIDGQHEKLIFANPAEFVKISPPKSVVGKAYTVEEVQRLFDVAKDHRLFPALVLFLTSGLRRGELLALTWDKIDFTNKRITISANYVKTLKGGELRLPKTTGSISVIPLNDYAAKLLEGMERKSNIVFCDRNGNYMRPMNFQRLFATWRKKAGIVGRIQDLRHTFATWLLDNNTPLHTACSLTRHTSASTLTKIYAHTTKVAQTLAINTVSNNIEGLLRR